jgi:hypothetical protein
MWKVILQLLVVACFGLHVAHGGMSLVYSTVCIFMCFIYVQLVLIGRGYAIGRTSEYLGGIEEYSTHVCCRTKVLYVYVPRITHRAVFRALEFV